MPCCSGIQSTPFVHRQWQWQNVVRVQEANGKLFCNYGGKTLEVQTENEEGKPETIKSTANLRLSAPL
ncbi:hypothetical protein DENIT_12423 [Pseudomonas veronii]|nr:hypothetical protein DENIT_12423 [Pseudomonas veronii]